jgi:hypothetical protein
MSAPRRPQAVPMKQGSQEKPWTSADHGLDMHPTAMAPSRREASTDRLAALTQSLCITRWVVVDTNRRCSLVRSANACAPPQTSADLAAGLSDGGSCHANAVDSGPARATGGGNSRDHIVMRLRDRCRRHSLRRRCNGQSEARNSNQFDHFAPPLPMAPKASGAGRWESLRWIKVRPK